MEPVLITVRELIELINERINDSASKRWLVIFNDGTALSERIPQAQQSGLSKGSTVLTAAAIICRGCPPTESDVRQIYDTDDLVGDGRIQERLVELDISSISQLKQTLR